MIKTELKVLEEEDLRVLELAAAALIDDGWVPLGGVQITIGRYWDFREDREASNSIYLMTLVRRPNESQGPRTL